jgi:hypothetical protein
MKCLKKLKLDFNLQASSGPGDQGWSHFPGNNSEYVGSVLAALPATGCP